MSEFLVFLPQDIVFAALAGIGFCLAANPPLRILPLVAAFAAFGHALRFTLLETAQIGISTGSLLGGFVIGLCSIVATTRTRVPAEFFAFPALLPMIPGLYAYKAILSLFNFMSATSFETKQYWLILMADNGFTALLVVCALGAGALIPIMLFQHSPLVITALWKKNRKRAGAGSVGGGR